MVFLCVVYCLRFLEALMNILCLSLLQFVFLTAAEVEQLWTHKNKSGNPHNLSCDYIVKKV